MNLLDNSAKYKIKSVEGRHSHLSPEELHKLEDLQLGGKYAKLQKTKDSFLFCCYAGLRYSDFTNLTSANIVEFQQETWLIYKSVKTGIEVRLPLYLLFERFRRSNPLGKRRGIIVSNKLPDKLSDLIV